MALHQTLYPARPIGAGKELHKVMQGPVRVSRFIGIWCMAAGCCTESWPCLTALPHLWISWWQVINRSTTELPLTVSYDKISLGRLRFWIHMQDAVYSLQQFGGCPRAPGQGGMGCLVKHELHAVAPCSAADTDPHCCPSC